MIGRLAGKPVNTDRITFEEIAKIVGVERKTVANHLPKWKKEYPELADQIFDGCSYSIIQPILADEWPNWFEGVNYAAAKEIWKNRFSQ